MTKGINLYLTKLYNQQTLIPMISKAGFESVIVVYSDIQEVGKENLKNILEQNNLQIAMIHCNYEKPWLDDFWLEGEGCDKLFNYYLEQIEEIKDFAPVDFVVHLCNSNVPYTEVGGNRLKALINKAKEYGIRVCVENTFSQSQQIDIFNNIKDKNLTMCYDCGHENWLTKGADYISKIGGYITQTHLHNNYGTFDNHQPLRDGEIDYFDSVAKALATLSQDYNLCLEIKFIDDRFSQQFLNEMKADLDLLANKIDFYKNKKEE